MENTFIAAQHLLQNVKSLDKCPQLDAFRGESRAINEIVVTRMGEKGWALQLAHIEHSPCLLMNSSYQEMQLYAEKTQLQSSSMQFLIRTALECRFCYEGMVSLHAACVEQDGYAVAFTGHSGLGKSTRAKAWVDGLGAAWISGDRPAIRLEQQGGTVCGVPWDGKEQIFRNVERPLKCIMEVRRSPLNYVRKLSAEQAQRLLMQQSFVPMWDTDAAVMAMMNVRGLIRQVPVYRVFCGPEEADAKAVYDILFNHPERIRKEAKDMKIKKGFVLRNVVDEFIVMPTGDNIAKFEGAAVLNDVSAFIFKQMENPISREDLLDAILNEYDVDEATAAKDLDALLEQFETMNILEK